MSDNANPSPEVFDHVAEEENISFSTVEPIHAEEMGVDDQLNEVNIISVEDGKPYAYAEVDISEVSKSADSLVRVESSVSPDADADDSTMSDDYNTPIPPTTVVNPVREETISEAEEVAKNSRGTMDLGLFIMRAMLGVVMALDGADKLFGLWGGSFNHTQEVLTSVGFTNHTELWAILLGVLEIVAGSIVTLGIFVPFGGAVLLTTLGITILIEIAQEVTHISGGQNLAIVLLLCLAAMASAVILVGAGRWAVDGVWTWATRPKWGALAWWILGLTTGPVVWAFANTQGFPF